MKLKKQYNKKFKVLQLDGGGMKGVIFLMYLMKLEELLKKPCHEIFNLIIGTSTGGISATALASGMSAKEVFDMYKDNAKNIFKRRLFGFFNPMSWVKGSVYKREFVDGLMKKLFPMPMKKLKCDLIITSVNMRDSSKTSYFKSYKKKYANVKSCYPTIATYSAPTFFGYYKDTNNHLKAKNPLGGVWSDGGVGVENCTLLQAYIETQRLAYKNNYFILSCGTGYTDMKVRKTSLISQVKDYLPIAKAQATTMQVRHCRQLGVNFVRVDTEIDSKYDKIDKVKYFNKYAEIGNAMTYRNIEEIVE